MYLHPSQRPSFAYPLFKPIFMMAILLIAWEMSAQTVALLLTVEVSGFQNREGQVVLDIYTDDKNYQKEKKRARYLFPKSGISGDKLVCQLFLPPGQYGIAALDDENESGKVERNLLGYPREGFGFSGLVLRRLRRPDFEEFNFNLTRTGQSVQIVLIHG